MYNKHNNSRKFFYQKKFLVLLMVIFPISTLAKEQCAGPDGNGPVCHQETVDTIVVPTEKTKAFDVTTLYYSGSILSNQLSSYEFSSPLEGKNAVGSQTREALVEDSFRSNIPTSGLENGLRQNELYNEISNQFRSFDTSGRKKIQRCLRYGSYQGKIDGLWGNQTFDAIVSFDETSELAIQVTEEHIFSKLKNIFSNKKFCYNLIADSFQL